jgi:hypothetical protein
MGEIALPTVLQVAQLQRIAGETLLLHVPIHLKAKSIVLDAVAVFSLGFGKAVAKSSHRLQESSRSAWEHTPSMPQGDPSTPEALQIPRYRSQVADASLLDDS